MTETTIDLAQKITITFDEVQDRLLWVLALNPENTISRSYWVTHRMSRQLIQALIDWLENNTHQSTGIDKNTLQSWEQAAAQQQFQPSEAATWQPQQQALALNIDLKFDHETLHLIFNEGERPTAISMKEVELRQILQILYTTFHKANWPTDIWPNWITGETLSNTQEKSSLH